MLPIWSVWAKHTWPQDLTPTQIGSPQQEERRCSQGQTALQSSTSLVCGNVIQICCNCDVGLLWQTLWGAVLQQSATPKPRSRASAAVSDIYYSLHYISPKPSSRMPAGPWPVWAISVDETKTWPGKYPKQHHTFMLKRHEWKNTRMK